MSKKIFTLFFILFSYLTIVTLPALAVDITPGRTCVPARIAAGTDRCVDPIGAPTPGYSCLADTGGLFRCERDVFGQVEIPQAIKDLGVGSGGISNFLNMLIILIYIIAGIVFVFMILWGAFQFLTSGGNKESLDSARKRIIYALTGITLFAIAFAVISLIGRFTGFTFFSTQTSIGCTTPSRYFIDPNTLKCIQTVHRNNVPYNAQGSYVMGQCVEVFIEVEDRFCR